jgi:hypothetical protein
MKIDMLKAKVTDVLACPTAPHEVTPGKFGWYPCSWQMYRKIKLLNFLLLLSKRQEAARDRYFGKLPHNRVIRKEGKVKLPKPIPIPEPLEPYLFLANAEKKDAWKLEEDYRSARFPKASREEVVPLKLSPARIDELLALAAGRLMPQLKEAV